MLGKKAQIKAAKKLFEHLAELLETRISVRLWDGTTVPLGSNVEPGLALTIKSPGVISSLLRKPTPENLLRHYARGHIDYDGADLMSFLETARVPNSRKRAKKARKSVFAKAMVPFALAKGEPTTAEHAYEGDESGLKREQAENRDFIQFHYDVSNEFYQLFLDPNMVYSCAYFRDWDESVEQAQINKLDMICRKLQLQPGDRFLDIGCGWGALVCHAAKHYGVQAHGITLSDRQLEFAKQKIADWNLSDQVTVEIRDYADMEGQFDKISSIGMVEHVGIDNLMGYTGKVKSLLRDRGIFLNHGITRPAKATDKQFRKQTPERRLLNKYIFPGSEVDHIGHMTQVMEACGFDVHDVEGWRDHYALTCKRWCQKLEENKTEAIKHIGAERYRMWVLYLAGVAFAFKDGSARIYQTVATSHSSKGISGMPPTREHLYESTGRTHRRAA